MTKLTLMTILLALTITSHAAVVAIFTGFSEQVQTVTGLFVWRCEYDYFGQKFYRLFKSHCPGTIEVE